MSDSKKEHLQKYPRTYHLPNSPGLQNDDRLIESLDGLLNKEVIVTIKMDGENTTMYKDKIHARSLDSAFHMSRTWVRGLQGNIGYMLPSGMRICGENLYAQHSIHYPNLKSYFLVFNIWDKDICLSWDETNMWCEKLGLDLVTEFYRGPLDLDKIHELYKTEVCKDFEHEGYVIRIADQFSIEEFNSVVVKWVREGHVCTNDHWMHQKIEQNELIK